MARIRTVKPDFFRHEALQDLEKSNPGNYVMLVFAGLWTVADKAGRFEWKPRTLKLDILPFLDFDMEKTLLLLERFSLIAQYERGGKLYGLVNNFERHQRINGKEAQEPSKYPEPIEFNNLSEGSNGEATGKQSRSQEGKGMDIGNGMDIMNPTDSLSPPSADDREKIPYEKIRQLYNSMLPDLPECKVLTSKRKAQIRARWHNGLPKVETWERFFAFVSKSDFLMGRVMPTAGRKQFVADLEWLTNETNYTKIFERKYHGKA